ncbi:MAG: hypothetical protein ACU83U_09565 [Gammaproteobacteria bacterium]
MDDIFLLVTVRGKEVLGSYEIKLSNMDFSSFGAGCFEREGAIFSSKQRAASRG